jgi:hypothetical protein
MPGRHAEPDEGAPLTALFDTGGFALERGAASLVICSYMRQNAGSHRRGM